MKYNTKVVLKYYRDNGLPEPKVEYYFHPARRFRMDFAWPEKRVALEVDGGVWVRGAHGRGSGIVRDHEKQNLAATLGWRILRVQPKEVCMLETVELIRESLRYEHEH